MENYNYSINSKKPITKICFVSSVDITLKFLLLPNLKFLQSEGYKLSVVCSPGKWVKNLEKEEGLNVKTIVLKRKISPFSDLIALFELYFYFKKEKFDIVHTFTPKAGLLGQIVAKMAGVPIICNTIFGFYFHEGTNFFKRKFFVFIEKIAAKFSDIIFSINREDIKTAIEENICTRQKIKYCGIGVNIDRFNPERFTQSFIEVKKKLLGITPSNIVLGIVARFVREKGYLDLFDAFNIVIKKFPNAIILIVGINEPGKKDSIQIQTVIKKYGFGGKILFLGERVDTEEIYPLMDIFILPSYREGLSVSLLEAQATGKPVIATNIRGCREAVDKDKTGILVSVNNPDELASAIIYLISHPEIAKEMGKNGRTKIETEFNEIKIFNKIEEEYKIFLKGKSRKSVQSVFKNFFDFVCSLAGLILLSPLFLIIAVLIKLDSKGTIFFRQERVGLGGKVFKIWKFRTMVQGAEKIGLGFSVAEKDSRITTIGRFLRRFGIDEIPQLINVVLGQMSVVGPRATLVHQVAQYTEFEKQRLKVKPGITNINLTKGWNTLPWKKRIEWDVWYIEHWSLWLDLKILVKTPIIVLSGKGQYGAEGVVEDYK